MSDAKLGQTILGCGVFSLLFIAILFLQLLPLKPIAYSWFIPDYLLMLSFAWSARRPAYAPTLLLLILFLLADLLLQKPPGLWAMLSLIACEWLKAHARVLSQANLWRELIEPMILIGIVLLATRFMHALLLIDYVSMGDIAVQIIVTMLVYPLFALSFYAIFRVKKRDMQDYS